MASVYNVVLPAFIISVLVTTAPMRPIYKETEATCPSTMRKIQTVRFSMKGRPPSSRESFY